MSNSENNIVRNIIDNYDKLEESIVSQLFLDIPNHRLTEGVYREQIWKSLFEQIIPRKFAIEQSVFIIDSHGNVSREIDLAIFDEQYTPYIFNYGEIRFIPIEAVAVVIQCKSKTINKKDLQEWVESVDKLRTETGAIVRMAPQVVDTKVDPVKTQTATRPIKILCHLNPKNNKNIGVSFDIKLGATAITKKLDIDFDEKDSLNDWYIALNHARSNTEDAPKSDISKKLSDLEVSKGNKKNSLLSLIFQLNQLLMLINNPLLFPHKAYVDMFKEHVG